MAEWIRVAERLPESGVNVLIVIHTRLVFLAWLNEADEWEEPFGDLVPYPVTHWQPLPDPPE